MKIGSIIQKHLTETGTSQRQFAKNCGLSNGYISMLVNGANPKTGKPLTPSLGALMSLSKGLDVSLDELLAYADDINVSISIPPQSDVSADEQALLDLFRLVPEEQKDLVFSMIKAALENLR